MPKKNSNGASNLLGFLIPLHVVGFVIGIGLSLISIPFFGFKFAKALACTTFIATVALSLGLFYIYVEHLC